MSELRNQREWEEVEAVGKEKRPIDVSQLDWRRAITKVPDPVVQQDEEEEGYTEEELVEVTKSRLTAADIQANGLCTGKKNRQAIRAKADTRIIVKEKAAENKAAVEAKRASALARLTAMIPDVKPAFERSGKQMVFLKNVDQVKAMILAYGGTVNGSGSRGDWEARLEVQLAVVADVPPAPAP